MIQSLDLIFSLNHFPSVSIILSVYSHSLTISFCVTSQDNADCKPMQLATINLYIYTCMKLWEKIRNLVAHVIFSPTVSHIPPIGTSPFSAQPMRSRAVVASSVGVAQQKEDSPNNITKFSGKCRFGGFHRPQLSYYASESNQRWLWKRVFVSWAV